MNKIKNAANTEQRADYVLTQFLMQFLTRMQFVVGFRGAPTAGWRNAPAYSPRGIFGEVLSD